MLKRAVVITQDALRKSGHFAGAADGVESPALAAAATSALEPRAAELSPGDRPMTDARRLVMVFQLACKDKGIDSGLIDGFWGPVTLQAYDELVHLLDHGTAEPQWRDDEPSDANPNVWPRDRKDTGQREMIDFYGPPGNPPMKTVPCPWTLRFSWNTAQKTQKISCHKKVAGSVESVLAKVFAHYGEAEIKRLRLDLYGGCFNNRPKRGGTSKSTHAWAVALDWDPDRNQLKWGRDKASLDASDYDFWWHAWEAEGWVSLGRSRNFDWMHVQAARL